jgi:hypothetical protein
MSYYGARGDFYTGSTGYYRGDPGFFSSIGHFLGGAVKTVGGLALNYATGGIGGAALGLLGGGAQQQQSVYGPVQQPTMTAAASAPRMSRRIGYTAVSGKRLSGIAGMVPMAGMGGPLVTRGQVMHPAGVRYGRRSRRMNVCNPRALRRAIRRAKGFEKLALRSIRLVSPQRLRGKHRGGFKRARARK